MSETVGHDNPNFVANKGRREFLVRVATIAAGSALAYEGTNLVIKGITQNDGAPDSDTYSGALSTLNKYNKRLNPKGYAFGVSTPNPEDFNNPTIQSAYNVMDQQTKSQEKQTVGFLKIVAGTVGVASGVVVAVSTFIDKIRGRYNSDSLPAENA